MAGSSIEADVASEGLGASQHERDLHADRKACDLNGCEQQHHDVIGGVFVSQPNPFPAPR